MLDYDPKLPNAVSKMFPIVLWDVRPQLRQRHKPTLCLGLVADIHSPCIIAGLAAPTARSIEGDSVAQPTRSIAYALYKSRPKPDHINADDLLPRLSKVHPHPRLRSAESAGTHTTNAFQIIFSDCPRDSFGFAPLTEKTPPQSPYEIGCNADPFFRNLFLPIHDASSLAAGALFPPENRPIRLLFSAPLVAGTS